jgi:hypothetical protein
MESLDCIQNLNQLYFTAFSKWGPTIGTLTLFLEKFNRKIDFHDHLDQESAFLAHLGSAKDHKRGFNEWKTSTFNFKIIRKCAWSATKVKSNVGMILMKVRTSGWSLVVLKFTKMLENLGFWNHSHHVSWTFPEPNSP